MALGRNDTWLTDAQGRALAGAQVYYCNPQPATTSSLPPSPLGDIYTDSTGSTPLTQPVITDGFGHAVAYGSSASAWTLVFVHPLFGPNPVVLVDQVFESPGNGGGGYTPFSGMPTGTIDGTNTVFTFSVPSNPASLNVWKNYAGIPGLDYTVSWAAGTLTITFGSAPQVNDVLFLQGWY